MDGRDEGVRSGWRMGSGLDGGGGENWSDEGRGCWLWLLRAPRSRWSRAGLRRLLLLYRRERAAAGSAERRPGVRDGRERGPGSSGWLLPWSPLGGRGWPHPGGASLGSPRRRRAPWRRSPGLVGAVRQAVAPRLRHDQGRPGRASMSGAGSDREDVGRISMHAAHGRKGAPRARPAGPVPFSLSGPYRRSVRRQGRTVGHPAPFPAEPAFRRPPGRRRG